MSSTVNGAQFLFPPEGHIFLCEIEGRLRSMTVEHASLSTFTNATSRHPNANVTRETLHHAPTTTQTAQQLFLPTREPFSKRVISTWYQQGVRSALELIAEEGGGSGGTFIRYVFSLLDKISRTKTSVPAHISSVFSPIRLVAWHPHILALAVVAWDDSIRLFSSQASLCCILKTKMQRSVNCLAWRPYTACQLAVGCDGGVVLWNRDPNNKTSMVCVSFLQHPSKAPVTSLAWNPQGDVLLTASSSHGDIHVWNVDSEQYTTLPRRSRDGTGLVLWSPSNLHLLSASTGVSFHVWNRKDWSAERWAVTNGRVVAACFSPCGSVLLFTSSEEPFVFAISLRQTVCAMSGTTSTASQQAAQLVIDHSLAETVTGISYGGLIKTMIWDPRGHHLAIISYQSDVITVYNTQIGSTLDINPCCVINGKAGEKPNHICFQPDFEEGSQLTIAWSSGRIQYFPFIYADTLPKPTPLQDIAPLLQRISSPQAPIATPVHQPQSSPVFNPTLSTPPQAMQSPYSSIQQPYSSSPLQPPFSSSPLQTSYPNQQNAPQTPVMTPQQLSFYSPNSYQSSPQQFSTPVQTQNTTPQHSFNLNSSPLSPLHTSFLRSPQQTSTPLQPW